MLLFKEEKQLRFLIFFFYRSVSKMIYFQAFCNSANMDSVNPVFLVLLALRAWIQQHHVPFLWLSGAAILIFRTELALFLGILLLMDIIGQRVSIVSVVMTTIPAAVVLLGKVAVCLSHLMMSCNLMNDINCSLKKTRIM